MTYCYSAIVKPVSHLPWAQEVWSVISKSSLGPRAFNSPDIFLMSEKTTYGMIWLWGRRKGELIRADKGLLPQILEEANSVIVVPYCVRGIDFQKAYESGKAKLASPFLLLTNIDNWGSEMRCDLKSGSCLYSDCFKAKVPDSQSLHSTTVPCVSKWLIPESLTDTKIYRWLSPLK